MNCFLMVSQHPWSAVKSRFTILCAQSLNRLLRHSMHQTRSHAARYWLPLLDKAKQEAAINLVL